MKAITSRAAMMADDDGEPPGDQPAPMARRRAGEEQRAQADHSVPPCAAVLVGGCRRSGRASRDRTSGARDLGERLVVLFLVVLGEVGEGAQAVGVSAAGNSSGSSARSAASPPCAEHLLHALHRRDVLHLAVIRAALTGS